MRVINRFRLITNQIKARHSKTLYSSILSIIMGSHNNSESTVIILIREQRKCRERWREIFLRVLDFVAAVLLPLINNLIQHISVTQTPTHPISDNDSENKEKNLKINWRSRNTWSISSLPLFLKLFFSGDWIN